MAFKANKTFRRQVGQGVRALGRAIAAGIRLTRQKRLQRIRTGELQGSVPRRHSRARGRASATRYGIRTAAAARRRRRR